MKLPQILAEQSVSEKGGSAVDGGAEQGPSICHQDPANTRPETEPPEGWAFQDVDSLRLKFAAHGRSRR